MTSTEQVVRPARRIAGVARVPGDKSISHRALILGALAQGQTCVRGLAPGEDCRATWACLTALGVRIRQPVPAGEVVVEGVGIGGLQAPSTALDARNSGTTARLLMGVLAGQAFAATITGDDSLRRRPMRRVVDPLALMGARIATSGGYLPATVSGGQLSAIAYHLPVPSAQVKSAILLAGLHAEGRTVVTETLPTRDHTERALRAFGADIEVTAAGIAVTGRPTLRAVDVEVPGDPSSAAFLAAAAAGLPGSSVVVPGVGLNPGRVAFIHVLKRMGARVEVQADRANGAALEPVGTITVRHGTLNAVEIVPEEVPGVIDELPALAALATYGGQLVVTGARELRVKESDRITALAAGLRALGADIEEYDDGFRVTAGKPLTGGTADAAGDHRLAMAFAIAALGATGESRILGADAVSVSYPGFFEALERLCA